MSDERRHTPAPPGSRASGSAEWPELLTRMLDDMASMADMEARLLEAQLVNALDATMERALHRWVSGLLWLIGGLCLLSAAIMLLGKWLPLWQSLAIGGAIAIVAGLVVWPRIRRGAEGITGPLGQLQPPSFRDS
jgi:hypothetical protein